MIIRLLLILMLILLSATSFPQRDCNIEKEYQQIFKIEKKKKGLSPFCFEKTILRISLNFKDDPKIRRCKDAQLARLYSLLALNEKNA